MSAPLQVFKAPLKGISLVEASAGTGKTYNITSLYVRAVIEQNLIPSQILVMTYTEAATAELKFRIRNRLKASLNAIRSKDPGSDPFLIELLKQDYPGAREKLENAIDQFDESAIFTIHGFCTRLLTEYSLQFDAAPNFELLTDKSDLLQDCVDSYWRNIIQKADTDPDVHFILDYLTDIDFGPDELKEVLNTVLDHTYADIVPKGLNVSELVGEASKLNKMFKEVKKGWMKEGEALKEVFFSGWLDGNKYRKNKSEEDWAIFVDWIEGNKASINYSDRLEKFGVKLHNSGKKASPDIPEFQLCHSIEAYMELADHLKLLKPAFIQNSISIIRKEFKKQKKEANLLTYSDLLEMVDQGLGKDASGRLSALLSEKYPLALVDEFQDTDPIQYSILRHIYGNKSDKALFMIGDPKQAIYGFRGADIFTYLQAKSNADEGQSYDLDHNFRSNSRMIKGVNELFQSSHAPFLIEYLDFHSVSFPSVKTDNEYITNSEDEIINPLQSILIEDSDNPNKGDFTEQIYCKVVDEILDLLSGKYKWKGREVQEKDIAVLIRKGFQGEEIQGRLREKGINSVLRSRTSVYDTQEASELFIILKAIQKTGYEPGLRAALSTALLGYRASDIQELLEDENKWSAVDEKFLNVKDEWDERGISAAIEDMLEAFNVQHNLVTQNKTERRFTNLMHLSELLDQSERQLKLNGKALLKWFFGKLNADGNNSEEDELRLESDEDLIQISTIHASKGLEYPIVLCPFLWDSSSSIKSGDIYKFYEDGLVHIDISENIDHPGKEHFKELAELQNRAEDVRLAYVAFTRAISACYLFLPDYKDISKSSIAAVIGGLENDGIASFHTIKNRLEECEHIEVRNPIIPQEINHRADDEESLGKLKASEFNRKDIYEFERMLSYSSLAEGIGHVDNEHDYDALLEHEFDKDESVSMDKFGFPKGANAGTCLHKIFEDIQFDTADNLDQVVKDNLSFYGFSEEWIGPVKQWINKLLMHPLSKEKMYLNDLEERDVLKEMEFFFPVEGLQSKELWNLVRDEVPGEISEEVVSGFMKGFIDLTFRVEEQYYILDYKSNHLGDQPGDYDPQKLSQAITDAGYDLQYHIYTLALHRFLKQRITGYNYEDHFGGVLYLFLRGIKDNEAGSGVYFDKPSLKLIDQLDAYFTKGGI